MPCHSCGASTSANDQFCSKCGQPQQEAKQQFSELIEDTPENEVVATCPHCSAGVSPGQFFCTVCGKSLLEMGEDDGD
jgi:predicted amidophosphoribosyltransferase